MFDFGPDGTQFAEPIEITVSYDPADVPAGVPEASLRLFVLVDGIWEALDGFVDITAKTITGVTDHFSTFGTLSLGRFCPGSSDPTTFATFADALDAVIPGGTIEVCDGTHVVEGAVIDQAVTIRPELNASPVIETSVALTTFLLDGYASGTVLFDGLTFDFSTPTGEDVSDPSTHSYVIRGKGTYDQLIVRNSTFNIDLASRGSVLLWTNTVTGSATLVENTTFNGGAGGVSSFEAGPDTQLNVRTSQFFGTRFFGLAYDGSSGRVENSTFTDCFGGNCIFAGNGSHVDVVSNVFGAPDLSGVVAFSLNNIVQYRTGSSGLVDDNDFGGCGEFRCVRMMHVGTQVDVTNNRFQVDPSDAVNVSAFHSVVRHDFGAIGTVENNQFTGCFYACIGVYRGAVVSVLGNDISIPFGHSTTWAIHGFEGNSDPPSLTIEDNTIIADLTDVDPSDPSTFRITGGGIAMDGAIATVFRNTIVGAAIGVSAFNDGLITAGEDNIIDRSNLGVMSLEDTSIKLNFNDITNSFVPIFAEFITSDLDCNWWGDIAGPASTADVVDSDTFTPFATVPIAGTDHSGCSPLTAENLLVGSWTATSIIRDGVEILVGTDLSFNFTFRSDLTFSESVSGDASHLFCDTTSCTDGGTYVFTSTHLSLCDPNCDEIFEYAISGNTITVTFEEGGVLNIFTFVVGDGPVVLRPTDLCSAFPANSLPTFADENLEAVVRLALEPFGGQDDLTCGRLSGLQSVSQPSVFSPIESLDGIQNLTDLRVLLLTFNNSFTDLGPLSDLTSLAQLQLNHGLITDISLLADLTSLVMLTLTDNLISDISALSDLTNLERVRLSVNSISDISALSGLLSLTELSLTANLISDISPLSGLPPKPRTSLSLGINPGLSNIDVLIANAGLGAGDDVDLRGTTVSCEDVALLQAKGVTVVSDCL